MTQLRRLILINMICFLAMFIFVSHVQAIFDSNVDKAKEFMQAGMYPQAIALLEKEISDNPTNSEAHFQLGICYVNQNNYSSADERFASAVRLKPDYGYKIGKEYKLTADFAANKNRLSKARTLYDKAIEYDPSLNKVIAQKLFQDGKQSGDDQLFSLAILYESSLRNNVADYYYSLSQNRDSLSLLAIASQYSDKYKKEYDEKKLKSGYSFLEEAKKLAKIPGKEKETKEYKEKAIKYLGNNAVEGSLPEHRIYEPGEYTFTLKAGEQTDHWLMFPYGRPEGNKFNITSKDDKYKLVYDDGDIVPGWTPGDFPHKTRLKFKIIAVTDQHEIKMIVK